MSTRHFSTTQEKNQNVTQVEGEQPAGKKDENVNASSGAAENQATKNPNNKDKEMPDTKDDDGQDQVKNPESCHSENGVDDKSPGSDKNPETSGNKDNLEETDEKPEHLKSDDPKKVEDTGLPPEVTLEPKNDKHADLRLISNGAQVSWVSVPVDDDEGKLSGETDFKDIEDFIQTNKAKTEDQLIEQGLLESGTKLASDFNNKVHMRDAISSGIINKYRLMWGEVLIILKKAFNKKNPKGKWMNYYSENFTKSSLSTAEKYMKLANIPNVIRWSFLGLERLEKIYSVIKDTNYMKEPDPVGAFFSDSDIAINFYDENLENWRNTIDVAVINKKIANHFDKKNKDLPENEKIENTVKYDVIYELISIGKNCDAALINDLYLYAKGGADPNVLLEDRLRCGGGDTDSNSIKGTLKDIKTLEGFPRIISELKTKIGYLRENRALIQKITPQHMDDLQKQVDELKSLVNEHPSAE